VKLVLLFNSYYMNLFQCGASICAICASGDNDFLWIVAAAGLGQYVEALVRKGGAEFNVCHLFQFLVCWVFLLMRCCAFATLV